MCGIAGFWGSTPLGDERTRACIESMRHRGPDDHNSQAFVSPRGHFTTLLFSRLSIIDLDHRANQPMHSQGVWITLNGEIYARRAGRVVAFLGYLHADDPGPMTVIDLIAVDSTEQGTGVGTATVRALLETVGRQGRGVLVGTQAANRGSVRLYENLGFRLDSVSYVLHGHQPASEIK